MGYNVVFLKRFEVMNNKHCWSMGQSLNNKSESTRVSRSSIQMVMSLSEMENIGEILE